MAWWEKIKKFLREVNVEVGKVTFPNRKETISTTVVVLAFVLLVAVYLGFVDMLLNKFVKYILG